MSPGDRQLMLDLLAAAEEWLIMITTQPRPHYADRLAARERTVDALAELSRRAGEGEP